MHNSQMKFKQGFFKPRNKNKYKGNPNDIVYRSSWELAMMLYLDKHQDVIWWNSESTVVPYISPIDNRWHRYFIDFTVCLNQNGKQCVKLIEVKPKKQVLPPNIIEDRKKHTKRYYNEVYTYGVNQAKWEAATKYAKERGWEFLVFTEENLFGTKG